MAKVTWSAGIDHVSGALSKPGKNGQHSCAKMLLGTHRTAATTNPDCNRIYLRTPQKRKSALSSAEIQARLRFKTVSRAIKDRKEDLSQVVSDQQAFVAQRDLPGGIKTMKAWYWKVCGEEYDAQH